MESVAAQKARLRAQFRAIREDLGEAGRAAVSEAICRRAGALVREQGARTVSAFWPLPGEVDLRPLLRQLRASGVTIALPVTLSAPGEAPRLEHRAWTGPLVAGRFGVQEPPRDAPLVPSERVDLAFVPALAVAMDGTRLGYGGGFYDAYLARTDALRLAVGRQRVRRAEPPRRAPRRAPGRLPDRARDRPHGPPAQPGRRPDV